jgi:hypothetical protein
VKSRGFCLEETHVTERERLEKLLALMTVAFCWAYLAGEWLARAKPIKIKKHGRVAKSLFRHGFVRSYPKSCFFALNFCGCQGFGISSIYGASYAIRTA